MKCGSRASGTNARCRGSPDPTRGTCLLALVVLDGDRLGLLERVSFGRLRIVAHRADLLVVVLGEGVLLLFEGVRLGHLVALHRCGPTRFPVRPQRRYGTVRPGRLSAAGADARGLPLREGEPA